uniref:Uncharacterized protein n=1 Tax=Panagrolaimus sp. JU765 TaxID=591449 RepID=A0AC34QG57_9BILA
MSLELNPIAHEFFNIVYSQAFSPNHDFLAISNNFGEVFATPAYPQDDPSNFRRMRFDSNVYSLATMKNANLLLCGSEYGLLEAFSWNQLTNNEGDSMEPKFSTNVNQREINSICVLNNEEHFVAAYGDGNLTLHSTARPEKV